MKKLSYASISASTYFWRTHSGTELDYVEKTEGNFLAMNLSMKIKNPKKPRLGWKATKKQALN